MSEIINQWIQDKLGIILRNSERFAEYTKDGRLLSNILKHYGIINEEQLNFVQHSSVREICLDNFKNHISGWLHLIKVELSDGEIQEIVDGKESTSISLFYRVYLKLNDKDNLYFTTALRLNQKLRPECNRFTVTPINESILDRFVPHTNKLATPLANSYDVLHWHQDRLEMLVNKCKAAREEYIGFMLRTQSLKYCTPRSCNMRLDYTKPERDTTRESVQSIDLTYNELADEKKHAKKMKKFVPDPGQYRKALKVLKEKYRQKKENAIFRTQLHRELLTIFWDKIKDDELEDFNKEITEKILTQSMYEKQMLRKLGEVKMQKEVMMENKQLISDAISKEKERDFVDKLLQKDKQLNDKEFQYYLDKERAQLLHKKIYEEKLKVKAEKTYDMCKHIVKDLCSLSFKESEYKEKYGEEPNKRVRSEWNKMFFTGESFDDFFTPVEKIISTTKVENEEMEELMTKEICRQNNLDKYDLQHYLDFESPWLLENIKIDQNIIDSIQCYMNLLGYIVFHLLEAKYPYPMNPDPPNFNKIEFAVCVNGLNQVSCLPLLQKILNYKQIIVVEMQDATNFCMDAYKAETKIEEDDYEDEIEEESKKAKSKEKKLSKPKKGAKSKSKKQEIPEVPVIEVVESDKMDKKIQTPRIYPDDEVILSKPAELGKMAYELLEAGNTLTDYLLVAMFTEFLRSKCDQISGWVLINYPTTLAQAAILEEFLSGVPIPGISDKMKMSPSISDISNLDIVRKEKLSDENQIYRRSKLVTNTKSKDDSCYYDTILTAYINIIQTDMKISQETGEVELPAGENPEDLPKLDTFYSDQGCNYSLYYKHFDFSTLKYLAKLIIGDYSIPPKTSIELFGDSIRYINADKLDADKPSEKGNVKSQKKGDKKDKPKQKVVKNKTVVEEDTTDTKKSKKKGDKKGKGGAGHAIIVHEDKFTQIPEVEIEEVEDVEEEIVKPGEPGWEYVHIQVPNEVECILATMWENIEEVYVEDFSQIFFMKRCMLNAVTPFVDFAKSHLYQINCRPDEKQKYLRDFQLIYNEFDDDIRSDEEFKAELHCRVHEMKEKLIEICDQKMMENEKERQNLILMKWAPVQLIQLYNNQICAFQLELDRFVDTLILVADYYTTIITKLPNQERSHLKEQLPRLDLEDTVLTNAINNILIQVDSTTEFPFNLRVEDAKKKALALVGKVHHASIDECEKAKENFEPSAGKPAVKSKSTKKDKKSEKDKNTLKIFEPDEEVKENYERIFEEWMCAIEGETARVTLRIQLLKAELISTLDEVKDILKDTFHGAFEQIKNKYQREVDAVNKACEVLFRSIESEVKITEELIFKDDDFFVDPYHVLFPFDDNIEPTYVEPSHDFIFTIDQLFNLTEIFLDLAPSGALAERSIAFLLQDMILNEDRMMVPKSWSTLTVENIGKLILDIFGPVEIITWKDFIIYNLQIPFPNEQQLLALRKKCMDHDPESTEIITKYDFKSFTLWFDNENEDQLRATLIQNLLLKLYSVNTDDFNYTAMLLDFCKGKTTAEGIGKALALSLGRAVCWNKNVGEKFVEETLQKRKMHDEGEKMRDEEIIEHTKLVKEVLNEVIDHTVHLCESVIIEDLPVSKKEQSNVKEFLRTVTQNLVNSAIPGDKILDDGSDANDSEIGEIEITKLQGSEISVERESHSQLSNVAIGFEQNDSPLVYFVELDVLQLVLGSALPDLIKMQDVEGHSFCETLAEIFEELRNSDFNNEVLVHQILNDSKFLKLLQKTGKFVIRNPPLVVERLISEKEKED